MDAFGHYSMASLRFGGGKTDLHPFRGLTNFGPYSTTSEGYDEISIIFAQDNAAEEKRLSAAIRDGLSPQFPGGFNKIFRTQIKVASYSITKLLGPEEVPAQFYEKFVENGRSGRIPIIIMDKTPKTSYPSIYYDTKAIFIKEGLVSQMATLQMLRDIDTFSWSVFPLSIQVYTKMGGIPYILYEKLGTEDPSALTFVVGTGISRVYSPTAPDHRYVGFALLFGPNGEWKIMKIDAKKYAREELASLFRNLVNEIANDVFNKYTEEKGIERINLIIHYTGKNLSGIEERSLWDACKNVEKAYGKIVVPSIVKINESSYRVKTEQSPCKDKSGYDTGLVSVGTALQIKPKFYMLFTIGCVSVGARFRASGRGSPAPILISIKDVGTERPLEDRFLLKSVFDVCRMNYTSINNPVNRMPTTVNYAQDIAYMMGRLGILQLPENISKRLWFI